MSSLKRALQREKRRGLVTQPEEPTQMKRKIEEERRQQTEAGWHQAPKCERWVQEQRDHFRTWWVILGGSGLRNGWEVQRRGSGETKWAAPGRGMGRWEVLTREGVLAWWTAEQPGERGKPKG